tara:strand:- start:2437 stop:3021 length:585 start_codon:yes stop_codon:yes gene_type:complete
MKEIAIIDYGAGNIKSLQFALDRLNVEGVLTSDPEVIKNAERVIFPGVGEASSAMKKLKKYKLDKLIPKLKQPVLGICLGMQLMCVSSEEGETKGLGIFDVKVKRFKNDLKVPQMGWNTINELSDKLFIGINPNCYMYSVHSFYASLCENTCAETHYGIKYSSALKKNNFYGVQFHPEKSSKNGSKILKNFIDL